MDQASLTLAKPISPGVRRTYTALAKRSNVARSTLHHRSKGRRSKREQNERQQYLSAAEESAVVKFLLRMADLGQPVRIKYIPSLAHSVTRHRPPAARPSKPLGKNWARSFEKRHPTLKARRVRSLDWNRHPNTIYDKMTDWFEKMEKVLQDPAVSRWNVYNWDETGIMLSMLGSAKVFISKEDTRNYRGARVERTNITAVECISADGRYLDPMIIWPASTHRAHWTTHPTPGWHYACSDSGYTDSQISLEWLKRVFDPQTKDRAQQQPRVLISDGLGSHETLEMLEFCFENKIILCRIPSHTSHKLQPCDVAVFGPLKAAYRDQVERLERGGINTIGKAHFTALYGPARQKAFSKKNILSRWAKSGLYPFHPSRALRDVPKTNDVEDTQSVLGLRLNPRSEACETQTAITPVTPVTPMTSEGLASLQQVIHRDAAALDEVSKRRLWNHLQKLSKAATTSFAERALQEEQIKFLHRVNNEAKARRTTRSLILGKAKVMSYEDLENARARRAAATPAAGGKSVRKKRGLPAIEADVMETGPAPLQVTDFAAPVARMI